MNPEPRQRDDYSPRQVGAARRVLVDLGQVLAAFEDCLVVVGGWVPDLLLEQADEPHVGSIDVDLALDANKLADGRYADLLKLLLDSGRYKPGVKPFQLVVEVDLKDGAKPVEVEVEFLAPREVKLKKNRPKLLEGFRVLQADGCGTAFHAPVRLEVSGRTVRGANNKVHLRIASLDKRVFAMAQSPTGASVGHGGYAAIPELPLIMDGFFCAVAALRALRFRQ